MEMVEDAATANADQLIRNLAEGYNTNIVLGLKRTSPLWRYLSHKEECNAAELIGKRKKEHSMYYTRFLFTHKLSTRGNTQTLLEALLLLLTSHYLLSWLFQMVWMPSPFIGMDGTLEKHGNIMLDISR